MFLWLWITFWLILLASASDLTKAFESCSRLLLWPTRSPPQLPWSFLLPDHLFLVFRPCLCGCFALSFEILLLRSISALDTCACQLYTLLRLTEGSRYLYDASHQACFRLLISHEIPCSLCSRSLWLRREFKVICTDADPYLADVCVSLD